MDDSLMSARERLDKIIDKARVDMYKPIHIAEVLHYIRRHAQLASIDLQDVETYRNPSRHWRDAVTRRLLSKVATSSIRYQDDVWNDSAMPPRMLVVLDDFNRASGGVVEAYIYHRFAQRQSAVGQLMAMLESGEPGGFQITEFLAKFEHVPGLRRSVDKAFEIVAHALFGAVIKAMALEIVVEVPERGRGILGEFCDLAEQLVGVSVSSPRKVIEARIFRVGVTNAADRGLDMWANFGPAVQVKHLSLDADMAADIVQGLSADHVVIVCRDVDADTVTTILRQLPVSDRIAGVIQQRQLVMWYEKALRGRLGDTLGRDVMQRLRRSFRDEFPQATQSTALFLSERGYEMHGERVSDWSRF